jgi:hypothetical protein
MPARAPILESGMMITTIPRGARTRACRVDTHVDARLRPFVTTRRETGTENL